MEEIMIKFDVAMEDKTCVKFEVAYPKNSMVFDSDESIIHEMTKQLSNHIPMHLGPNREQRRKAKKKIAL